MDEFLPAGDNVDRHDKSRPCLTQKAVCGGPVTFVKFVANRFLYSRGGWLHRSWDSVGFLVFPSGGVVHGLADSDPDSPYSLVFGGKAVAFTKDVLLEDRPVRSLEVQRQNDITGTSKFRYQLELSDWIWDARFLTGNDTNRSIGATNAQKHLLVGMAHHILEVMRIHFGEGVLVERSRRIVASPACLVTSMKLFQCSLSHKLWVAAGTSFQDIVVWSVGQDSIASNNPGENPQIQDPVNLSGHTGVVHSVQFSPDGSMLASTSDDRSVRLWMKNQKPGNKEAWGLAWSGWGHTARVWSVAFSPMLDAIVTSGEDHTVRIWSQAEGRQLTVVNMPSGSAWCVDVRGSFVLVGGNNGTLTLDDISGRIATTTGNGSSTKFCTILVPDDRNKTVQNVDETGKEEYENRDVRMLGISETEQPKVKLKKKSKNLPKAQVIVGMKWFDFHTGSLPRILVATRAGSLLSFNVDSQKWTEHAPWWDLSLLSTSRVACSDGCCMSVHPDGLNVAIGTTRGDIVIVSLNVGDQSPRRVVLSSGRSEKSVQSLTWVNRTTLLSFHVRTIMWWTFSKDLGENGIEAEGVCCAAFCLGTKAVPICFAYDSECERLVVGDSRGNIGLFQLNKLSFSEDSKLNEPLAMLHTVHQKEHVQQMLLDSNRIISVGNDGCLHVTYIESGNLRRGFSVPAGSLSGLERIWSIGNPSNESEKTLLVGGYFGNVFIVMDIKSGYEVFRIDTEGRQRSAACFIDTSSETEFWHRHYGLTVCANRKDGLNELMLCYKISQGCQKLDPLRDLKALNCIALHNETIFSVNLFSLHGKLLLLTGSEDCTSRLSICRSEGDDGSLLDSMSLTPQESCVRAVCSSQRDKGSALVVVGGGKLVLQFFLVRVATNDFRHPVTCLGLDVVLLGIGKTKANATIDHRINAVKATPLDGVHGSHVVFAGDSDGSCHVYLVNENNTSRHIFGCIIPVGPRPILSLELLKIGSRILMLIGTTSGEVVLWDIPGDAKSFRLTEYGGLDVTTESMVSPLGVYQAHQMGTNTISAAIVKRHSSGDSINASVLICSGGDDQAICVCEAAFSFQDCGRLSLERPLTPFVTAEASSSAVKGVAIVPHEHNPEVSWILSVGYSQRLAMWEYSSEKPESLVLVESSPMDIGDINCLGLHRNMVAVGGLGVGLTSISLPT